MSGDGKFITFEGIDSSGKGTQVKMLGEWLSDRGVPHLLTFEPGGTPFGLAVRELLLAPNSDVGDPVVELLLFLAARRHHLSAVILPALRAGKWVVCDRYADSTHAYQGGGGKVGAEDIDKLSAAAGIETDPDLTFLLDVSAETSGERQRIRSRQTLPSARGKEKSASMQGMLWDDKFESKHALYFGAVRGAYLRRAQRSLGRIKVVDADQPAGEVHREICRHISMRFGVD